MDAIEILKSLKEGYEVGLDQTFESSEYYAKLRAKISAIEEAIALLLLKTQ